MNLDLNDYRIKEKDLRCNIILEDGSYKSKFNTITSTIRYIQSIPNKESLLQVLLSWISRR